MKKYDAIIIGSGQSGTPLSKKLGNAGWNTALIEKRFIGGTCVNDGCTPTKAMVASAKMAWMARRSNDYGVALKDVRVNIKEVIERKNKIVQSFRNGSQKSITSTKGVDLIFGEAFFTGEKKITVRLPDGKKEELQADKIFIDTGGKTTIPNIPGINDINYLTSTTILDILEIPEHLLILGGSYIGLEFGQMFRRFGSNVTIVDTAPRFLPLEDEDISECLYTIMKEEGLTIYTKANVSAFKKENAVIKAEIIVEGGKKQIECSHVLIAAGRTPQTAALQLENTGVETDERGYIKVNDTLETNIQGIYAMGDVKGGPAFTHISYNDYVIISKNIIENKNATITNRLVPYCMFTDPQLGRIGLTERDAIKKGYKIKVAKLPMSHVARAIETGETRGLMKAVVDAGTKQILGAAIIGEQGGELMAMLQLAMMGGIKYDVLKEGIFAHPTYAEALNNLFTFPD